jgi:hypothetical protein
VLRSAELDRWLPTPQVRSVHRRATAADADALWAAAEAVRLDETRTLGPLVRWRIPGTPPDLAFRELLARYPFAVLARGERWSLSGLCGRIWTFARDYPELREAADFLAWDEPGTVRVLFGHWVEELGDGRSALVSEARVAPTDRGAALRLRALWLVIGHLERFVGAEPLPLAVARAEAAQPTSAAAGTMRYSRKNSAHTRR